MYMFDVQPRLGGQSQIRPNSRHSRVVRTVYCGSSCTRMCHAQNEENMKYTVTILGCTCVRFPHGEAIVVRVLWTLIKTHVPSRQGGQIGRCKKRCQQREDQDHNHFFIQMIAKIRDHLDEKTRSNFSTLEPSRTHTLDGRLRSKKDRRRGPRHVWP
jgi:hypothetical protein